MNSLELVDSFSEFKELKSIEKKSQQLVFRQESFLELPQGFLQHLHL